MNVLLEKIGLSKECSNLDVLLKSSTCIQLLISKVLGYAIVFGSSILKVPQILNILKAKSGKGVSKLSYLIDIVGFLIGFYYSYRIGQPFSTYGEQGLIAIQNVIVIFFIDFYMSNILLFSGFFTLFIGMNFGLLLIELEYVKMLNLLIVPIFAAAKLPQIYSNFKNGSTGSLSFITCFLQFAGSAVRVFTTLKEVDDIVILIGFVSGTFLNFIILCQILYYPSKKVKKSE